MFPVKRPAGGCSNAVANRADCYAIVGPGGKAVTYPEGEFGDMCMAIHVDS